MLVDVIEKRQPQVYRGSYPGLLETALGFAPYLLQYFRPISLPPIVPGAQRADDAMGKTIVSYVSASIIERELSPWLTNQLLMIGYQAFYFRSQLAWSKKVQADVEVAAAPLYLFFDVLQTKTHLFSPEIFFQQFVLYRKKGAFHRKKVL